MLRQVGRDEVTFMTGYRQSDFQSMISATIAHGLPKRLIVVKARIVKHMDRDPELVEMVGQYYSFFLVDGTKSSDSAWSNHDVDVRISKSVQRSKRTLSKAHPAMTCIAIACVARMASAAILCMPWWRSYLCEQSLPRLFVWAKSSSCKTS